MSQRLQDLSKKDSFGSFSSPIQPLQRDSFGSFQAASPTEEPWTTTGQLKHSPITEEPPQTSALESVQDALQDASLEKEFPTDNLSLVSKSISHPDASSPKTTTPKSSQDSLAKRVSVTGNSPKRRVSVSMPLIEPRAQHLPTRMWTDPNIFIEIPPQDPVLATLNKALAFQELASLPRRALMSVEEGLSCGDDPFLGLARGQSWLAMANLAK